MRSKSLRSESLRSKSYIRKQIWRILAFFIFIIVVFPAIIFIIVLKVRSLLRYRAKGLLLIILISVVFVVGLMNSFYPDGFTDRIMSLSPDYYNTIGAPARTSPEYEEEQSYNVAILGNTSVISTNDKEVAEGPFKKRLLSLMTNKGK
jgi:hypothetical protein